MGDRDQAALWDRKYKEGLPSLTKPDPYFVAAYERLVNDSFPNAGRALDLAAGLGRHALWLAERGWQVSAVDVSEVALGKLGQAAGQLNLNVTLLALDAAEYTFEPAGFDLIVLFYHLDRTLFPKIVSALNPGGLFICKMAVQWGSDSAQAKDNFRPLVKNELLSLVPELHVIDHHERPVRDRGVVEFVGKKAGAENRIRARNDRRSRRVVAV
jgi:SAM-dependent methyltransferase